MNMDRQWSKQEAYFARTSQVWLAANHNISHFWPMNSMFQLYFTAVNQIYVFHEAWNCSEKSEDLLKACFVNVNIVYCCSHCFVGFCLVLDLLCST